MKKRIIFLIGIVLLLLLIIFFYNKAPARFASNLEFWIGENVDNIDFSNHHEKYALMGGREYYGIGYIPWIDENGEQIDPEHCVIYTVTSYPDYISNQPHITHIFITDPTIKVYGLTLQSNIEEIEQTMKSKGFKIKYIADGLRAQRGKYTFSFSKESIRINVKVTNFFGIQF